MAPVKGDSQDPEIAAVKGENKKGGTSVLGIAVGKGTAVVGQAEPNGRGVVGVSDAHSGVEGNTVTGAGVWGSASGSGRGVIGISTGGAGVYGESRDLDHAAVLGSNAAGQAGLAGHFEGYVRVSNLIRIGGAGGIGEGDVFSTRKVNGKQVTLVGAFSAAIQAEDEIVRLKEVIADLERRMQALEG